MGFEDIIQKVADNNDATRQEVYKEMQRAINAAWNTTDELASKRQKQLFPNGKPTVEEFTAVIAKSIAER